MGTGHEVGTRLALQGALFCLKFELAYKLQDLAYQTKKLQDFRQDLVAQMVAKVRELNRENFAVRQHLRYVDQYAHKENYQLLTYEDTLTVKQELAPLLEPDQDEASALRFDALLYGIELAQLAGNPYSLARRDLKKKVTALATVANIPDIQEESDLINKILHTSYLDDAKTDNLEHIRKSLRDLMKYLPKKQARYDTNFEDRKSVV